MLIEMYYYYTIYASVRGVCQWFCTHKQQLIKVYDRLLYTGATIYQKID